MNILVTINSSYLKPLIIMLTSLHKSNPHANIDVYVAHSSLSRMDFDQLEQYTAEQMRICEIKVSDTMLSSAPISYRYPKEMYYRIFAAQYLPQNLDRILYLDPDLVVRKPVDALYQMAFKGNFYIATSHVHEQFRKLNELRLNMPQDGPYINSGVMMMNLDALRQEQKVDEVLQYIEEYKNRLLLPDQDVLSGLYGDRTLTVDPFTYNLNEKYFRFYNLNPANPKKDLDWVRENTVIIHYCGKNKPWLPNYHGKFGEFFHEVTCSLNLL